MQLTGEQLNQLAEMLESSQTIVVILAGDASLDATATAMAWVKVLQGLHKSVRLVSPEPPKHNELDQLNPPKVEEDLGKQNLVVSFEYSPEKVDKVSYHIGEETNRFYLTIKPQAGQEPLDTSGVEFSYAGAQADAILYVAVDDPSTLGAMYESYEEFFRNTPSVSLHTFVTEHGTVKVDGGASSCLSEETTHLLGQLGWEFDGDIATMLLRGIEHATDHLGSLSAGPETFDAVANLLRAGARRSRRAQPVSPQRFGQQLPGTQPGQQVLPSSFTLPLRQAQFSFPTQDQSVQKNPFAAALSPSSTPPQSPANPASPVFTPMTGAYSTAVAPVGMPPVSLQEAQVQQSQPPQPQLWSQPPQPQQPQSEPTQPHQQQPPQPQSQPPQSQPSQPQNTDDQRQRNSPRHRGGCRARSRRNKSPQASGNQAQQSSQQSSAQSKQTPSGKNQPEPSPWSGGGSRG